MRATHVRLLLALLVATIIAAPAALAQGAPPPTVTIEASQETLVVSRESQATLTVTVTYASQNPLDDDAMGRSVELEAGALPAGWSAAIEPRIINGVNDGAAARFTVTITLGAQARQSEQTLALTAKVSNAGFPGGTPVTEVVDPEATANAQVTLKRDDPLTREVLENVGGWIWALLGGLAILAVVLAVVLARSNRPVVSLSTGVKQAQVAPGRSVAIPVTVENLTSVEDTVIFHVAPLGGGWAASLPVPELPLDGRRREDLHLVVTAPPDARPGDAVQVGLTALGAQNPKRPAELVVDVTVSDTPARRAAGDTTPADVQKEQAKRK